MRRHSFAFFVALLFEVLGCAQDPGLPDAGSADAGTADAGTVDAGTADAGSADAGSVDAGSLDSGVQLCPPEGFQGFFHREDSPSVDNAVVVVFRQAGNGSLFGATCDSNANGSFVWRLGDGGTVLAGFLETLFAISPDGGPGLIAYGHPFYGIGPNPPEVETWLPGAVCPTPCGSDGGPTLVPCSLPVGWDDGGF